MLTKGGGISLVPMLNPSAHDDGGLQIHGVFGLVREVGPAVFHAAHPGVRIGGRLPFLVGGLLLFPFPVEPDPLRGGERRFLSRLLGQTIHILPIPFLRVLTHDAPHGRVGFHHGGIQTEPAAFQ